MNVEEITNEIIKLRELQAKLEFLEETGEKDDEGTTDWFMCGYHLRSTIEALLHRRQQIHNDANNLPEV